MNVSGDIMVEYTYDAWGNVLSITGPMADTMGQHNQLRYRGYVYDPETELYYLNSRFYNPETGRFINADVYPSTGQGLTGNNMFAYCGNNPVIRTDDSGDFWNIVIGAVVGAVISAASEIVSQVINHVATGEDIDWGAVATSAIGGAVYGGVMAATGSNTASTIASTATTSVITGIRNGDSAGKIVLNTAVDVAISATTCVVPKVINKSLSGKYAKLNKLQKIIKKITDETYVGRYETGQNHLPDIISSQLEDFGKGIVKTTIEALLFE